MASSTFYLADTATGVAVMSSRLSAMVADGVILCHCTVHTAQFVFVICLEFFPPTLCPSMLPMTRYLIKPASTVLLPVSNQSFVACFASNGSDDRLEYDLF